MSLTHDDCPGCTDPKSEGTHTEGTKQHPSRTSWAWLEVAASRIRAGEPEEKVLADYSYVKESLLVETEQRIWQEAMAQAVALISPNCFEPERYTLSESDLRALLVGELAALKRDNGKSLSERDKAIEQRGAAAMQAAAIARIGENKKRGDRIPELDEEEIRSLTRPDGTNALEQEKSKARLEEARRYGVMVGHDHPRHTECADACPRWHYEQHIAELERQLKGEVEE